MNARVTPIQWLICIVAAMGFAFDIYEILMMPLIVRPLLLDLGGLTVGTPRFNLWAGLLIYLPAMAAGIFGLLGGYLADLLGRRRALVWSLLLYAVSAAAAGFSTTLTQFVIWRCLTFVGVAVEYVAALAWVAELFTDPKRRESALGYTQAVGGLGGLMVTGAYYLVVTYAPHLPAIAGAHQAWRYMLISGLVPALPLMIVRPWLPDSPMWRANTSPPRLSTLFSAQLRRTTWLTMAMVACSYAIAYGALQQLPRVVAGLPAMASVSAVVREQTISGILLFQEFGHVAGRLAFALIATVVARQRRLLRLFQIPAMAAFAMLFFVAAMQAPQLLGVAVFAASFFTVGQFSFWGNYLPRVFPTRVRATGESLATNIGGRTIGTFAAIVTTQWANIAPGPTPAFKLAYAAGGVAVLACLTGLIASAWLPEESFL
jgi:MFS family permease